MALPGEAPPHLEMDPYSQDPAAPAVELAKEFAINVHPVRLQRCPTHSHIVFSLERVMAPSSSTVSEEHYDLETLLPGHHLL